MCLLFCQLYTRITKNGWFDTSKDTYIFRNVIDDVNRFLNVRLIFPFRIIYYSNFFAVIYGNERLITYRTYWRMCQLWQHVPTFAYSKTTLSTFSDSWTTTEIFPADFFTFSANFFLTFLSFFADFYLSSRICVISIVFILESRSFLPIYM